jgi:hypothetical protein
MRGQEHSTVGEGVVTGIIGAIIVASWWRRHPRLAHSFDQAPLGSEIPPPPHPPERPRAA